jgi:hypothetical protein
MTDSTYIQESNKWKKLNDLSGLKIEKWTILKRIENRYGNVAYWLCKCDCGNEVEVAGRSITQGISKQCKTCSNQINGKKNIPHGKCKKKKIPEYHIWRSMKERCTNPKNKGYHNYGERGIKVYKRWLNSFQCFLKDVGLKPSKNHSLDRIDNNRGYFPKNVRWATRKEQARNTRKQNLVFENKIIPICELEMKIGIARSNLIKMIRMGMTYDELFKFKTLSNHKDKSKFRKSCIKKPQMIGCAFNLTPSSPE